MSATIFMPIFIEQEPDDPMNEEESIDVCDGSVEATGDTTVDGNQQLEKVPQDGDIEMNTLTNSSKQNVDEVAETGTLLVPQDNEDGNAVEKDESELFGITNVT